MLFSIIIPTYNRASLILDTIRSVQNQIYSEFEIIIVDDGSTDNTEEIINNLNDNRIKYYKKKNEERGAARNYGVEKAKGEYINFVDSDDILYENHLLSAKNIIEKYTPDIFFFNYDILNTKYGKHKSNILPQNINIEKKLLKGNFISMNSIFLKKEILAKNKFIEDPKFIGGEDWIMWLKLSVRFKIKYYPITTSKIIQHDTRSVMRFDEDSFIYRTRVLINGLKKDLIFLEKNQGAIKKIKAHMFSYTSLHAIMDGEMDIGFKYFIKAIILNPWELLKKRSGTIIKRFLFHK